MARGPFMVRILALTLTTWLTPPAYSQQKYALVIGISGAPLSSPTDSGLLYADRDAREFADFIGTREGRAFPPNNVHLVTNQQADRDRLFQEFRWLKQSAGPADLVYVFFAGHGVEFDNESYFLPADANRKNVDSAGIPMREFFTKVTRDLSAKQVVVFVDACHSAAAMEGARDHQTIDIQREWDRLNSKEGQVAMAIFSSLSNQQSWEDPELGGGHGLFTWYLLEGLRGAAHATGDGWITAASVLEYVRAKVEAQSLSKFSRQTPISTPDFRTEFRLAITKPGTSTQASQPDSFLTGAIEVSSVERGIVYIDGREMGRVFERGRKTFQRIPVGKHTVELRGATAVASVPVTVEVGAISYSNFGDANPIDNSGRLPVGKLHVDSELGLSGDFYIDNHLVGKLAPGGSLQVDNVIAGNHRYTLVGTDGTRTEGQATVLAGPTLSLSLAPVTNLRAIVH